MGIYLSLNDATPAGGAPAPDPRQRDIAAFIEERDIPLDGRTLRALFRLTCALAVELGLQRFARAGASRQRMAADRLLHSTRWML